MYSRNSLEGALSSFISGAGASRGGVVKLWRAAAPGDADSLPVQREQLLADLALAGLGSRTIVWLWLALITAIFALSAGFAVYHRDNIGFVAASLLGARASWPSCWHRCAAPTPSWCRLICCLPCSLTYRPGSGSRWPSFLWTRSSRHHQRLKVPPETCKPANIRTAEAAGTTTTP